MKSTKKKIFDNVVYFDSIENKLVENQVIVVDGNRFSHIGDSGSFDRVQEDEYLDLSGKFVIPGLIDCHVHLELQMDVIYERQTMRTNSGMYYYFALNNAQKHLASGFTTVRDCGAKENWGPSLKQSFQQKLF